MNCRHCHAPLEHVFLDLGSSPPSNAYLTRAALGASETWYPLRVLVCDNCWLVQTEDHADREALFTDEYAYFSSFSQSWLRHSEAYVEAITDRLGLDKDSMVVEVAANDGYLLQFVERAGIQNYGVEPTASTARAAREKGIEIVEEFFGVSLAERLVGEGKAADLTAANNVLAHVPDINDFVGGFAALLKPRGVATFEFPHLLQLLDHNQFDTVYHEHYSYLSLGAVSAVFASNGLAVFDVEELPTHGGSLRVFAQKAGGDWPVSDAVATIEKREAEAGLTGLDRYSAFQQRAERVKDDFVAFLLEQKRAGAKVAGYGAAAKGNTLMNFAGVRSDLLRYVVDLNPAKAGKFMPGSRIPIVGEDGLREDRPDFVVILPWNLRDEISQQLSYIGEWGGRLVTAVPQLEIVSP